MKPVLALAALVLAAGAASAQSVADAFERRSFTANGVTVKYGLFVPEGYDAGTAYPLVLALHGNGERANAAGTDDLRNIGAHDLATVWASPAAQAERPAFVLAPQVPNDPAIRWSAERDPDVSDVTPIQRTVLEILASIEGEFTIDPDRIYIVGLSMGGHGTWDFVSRLPDRFAAAVPMSGESFPSQADDIAHLPVWAFSGEQDPASLVPPWETRRIVQAMEDLGRDVIYTHCRRSPLEPARAFDCPGPIGADSLAAAVAAHADLLYTSEANVGHGPWRPWFNTPSLAPWLFSKVRQDRDAVAVTAPAAGARWAGMETVTWTTTRTTADTVEVWVNRTDDPTGWQKLGERPIAEGAFAVDTGALADAAGARVRLWVRNADGRIAGRATSGPFAIDNPGNGAPALRFDAEDLRFDPALAAETYALRFTAGDPEGGALTAQVFYSLDGGTTETLVATQTVASSADPQTIPLDVDRLPNSRTARLRLAVDDGATSASAATVVFVKETPRDVTTPVERVAGGGEGAVEMRVVDADALTNHRYRLTIDASDPAAKTYAVTDLDAGTVVLTDVPFSDGVRESPVVDGLALVVTDLEEGRADLDRTGWVAGDSDLGVTVSGGSVRISILTIDLLATESDYEIAVTDGVVGRSISLYRIPEAELRFTVTVDGEPRDVVFSDGNGDGRPGPGDVLYLVEPDADGEPALAWKLAFSGGTEAPEAGDVFRLVPVRSLSAADVFEFTGRVGVATEGAPDRGVEVAAFPNPFADRLTVGYRLAEPASVTLEVFDALGRRVATLAEGPRPAGDHRAAWDGAAASGVYVVRLAAQPSGGPAVTVRRSVVRVGR